MKVFACVYEGIEKNNHICLINIWNDVYLSTNQDSKWVEEKQLFLRRNQELLEKVGLTFFWDNQFTIKKWK